MTYPHIYFCWHPLGALCLALTLSACSSAVTEQNTDSNAGSTGATTAGPTSGSTSNNSSAGPTSDSTADPSNTSGDPTSGEPTSSEPTDTGPGLSETDDTGLETSTTGDDTDSESDTDTDTGAGPCITFDRTYGAELNEYGNAILALADGGFVIAGRNESVGQGMFDAWLVRLSPEGDVLWEELYGTPATENINAIAQAPDGGFVLVGTTHTQQTSLDWWTLRTDPGGNLLWDAVFSSENADHAFAVVADDTGVTVAGVRDRIAQGSGRIGLVRYDNDGQEVWQQAYGDDLDEQLGYALVAVDGGYAVAGTAAKNFWLVRTDGQGTKLWDQSYNLADTIYERALDLVALPDGFALTGWAADEQNMNQSDIWLVRTDSDGAMLWNVTHDLDDFDTPESLIVREQGFVITGDTRKDGDPANLMLMALDNEGAQLWTRSYGGMEHDFGRQVVELKNGNLAIVGRTASKGAGLLDAWVLRTNSEGELTCP